MLPEVYATKLQVVKGPYQFLADPAVVKGIGSKSRFKTVGEAVNAGHLEAIKFMLIFAFICNVKGSCIIK